MLRALHSFMWGWYASVIVFLGVFVLLHLGGLLYVARLSMDAKQALSAGLTKDTAYLVAQGDQIAADNLLKQYIKTDNRPALLDLLQRERAAHGVGLMGVTNAEGVIIGRTKTPALTGNNTFLTTPQGRALSVRDSVQSIEVSGVDPTQLVMVTGRKIFDEGAMVGSLFANYLMDDAYAARFRDTYLEQGVEVVFYTKEHGVYGNSFADPSVHALVQSYFNTGSTWIKDGVTEQTIAVGNGNYYLVENVVFPGLESSPGGALVFVPRREMSLWAGSAAAGLTVLVFVLLVLAHHLRSRGEVRGWRYYLALTAAALPVFLLAFVAYTLQHTGFSTLRHVPYPLYNSVMRLQPEWQVYNTGFETAVSIVVDTGEESVNAISAGIMFDPAAVEIQSFDTASSSCSYVVESTIDTTHGEAKFSCVILDDKKEAETLPLVLMHIKPRVAGNFTFAFDPAETQVLANDGLATNVLRLAQNGNYLVADFNVASTSTTSAPFIFSPTHPNQSRWYNSSVAHFLWNAAGQSVYAYAFDSDPNTIPNLAHTVRGGAIDMTIPGDGIFYFHLKGPNGAVAHYKIRSDRTPPRINAMLLSSDHVVAGDVVRLSFAADDVASGVQRNYYVSIGDNLFLPVGSQLYIPFVHSGTEQVVLRVYDEAGNYSEKMQTVEVSPR